MFVPPYNQKQEQNLTATRPKKTRTKKLIIEPISTTKKNFEGSFRRTFDAVKSEKRRRIFLVTKERAPVEESLLGSAVLEVSPQQCNENQSELLPKKIVAFCVQQQQV